MVKDQLEEQLLEAAIGRSRHQRRMQVNTNRVIAKERYEQTQTLIVNALTSLCSEKGEYSKACSALEQINDRKAQATQMKLEEEKKVAQESSPEAILERACKVYNEMLLADKLIQHEKEVGQESGSINMTSLNQSGQMKVTAKHTLEKIKIEYKEKTGKDMDLRACKVDKTIIEQL